jgi:hypothetical protein
MFRTRKIRSDAKAEGKSFDDVAQEYKRQEIPFAFAERQWRGRSRDDERDVEDSALVEVVAQTKDDA